MLTDIDGEFESTDSIISDARSFLTDTTVDKSLFSRLPLIRSPNDFQKPSSLDHVKHEARRVSFSGDLESFISQEGKEPKKKSINKRRFSLPRKMGKRRTRKVKNIRRVSLPSLQRSLGKLRKQRKKDVVKKVVVPPSIRKKNRRRGSHQKLLLKEYRAFSLRHTLGSRGKLLSCDFCKHQVNAAFSKTLPCSHRFCYGCMGMFVANSKVNKAKYLACPTCGGKKEKVSIGDISKQIGKYPRKKAKRLAHYKFDHSVLPRYSILKTSPNYKKKRMLFCQVNSSKGVQIVSFKNQYIFRKITRKKRINRRR